MGRTSTKENKNSYQLAREELGLTREKASELLETIAPERIEKIENERTVPRPDEVLTMAEKIQAARTVQLLLLAPVPHRPGVCAAGLGAGAVRHRARDAGLPERNGQEKRSA